MANGRPCDFPIGSYVSINTSRTEYNDRYWMVVQPDDRSGRVAAMQSLASSQGLQDCNSRMVVQDCTGHQISVRVAAMQSLAVVPFGAPPPEPAVETGMLEGFCLQRLQEPNTLDTWLPLPGMGGNFILMRACGPGVESSGLLMYPALRNYQVWFFSTWSGDRILMQHGDVLKV